MRKVRRCRRNGRSTSWECSISFINLCLSHDIDINKYHPKDRSYVGLGGLVTTLTLSTRSSSAPLSVLFNRQLH